MGWPRNVLRDSEKNAQMATSTVENYLKQLYLEQRSIKGATVVPTGRLATAMGVVPGTTTSMAKA
jgi:Mn-dependent DtxR family transcriptional regulator